MPFLCWLKFLWLAYIFLQESTHCLKIPMLWYSRQPYIGTLSIFLNRRDLILKGFLESRHTPDIHMLMSRSAQGQETVLVSNYWVGKCSLFFLFSHSTNIGQLVTVGLNAEELFAGKGDKRPDTRSLLIFTAISWKNRCTVESWRTMPTYSPSDTLCQLTPCSLISFHSSSQLILYVGCD